ncbi:MAG: hypothetical protein A1D16_12620 [Flavihumibacter sp. CACIAM 22H1]|nr:MAG: hypothetical protein A1D16_12620 [Flavihumibacter sp. CACIAM 22H1]
MKYRLIFFLNFLCAITYSQIPEPAVTFPFNRPDYREGKPIGAALNPGSNPCSIATIEGVMKEGLEIKGNSCLLSTNALQRIRKDEFALSFFFKGGSFEFISYPKQAFSVTFNYPYFSFTTTTIQQGKEVRMFYKVDLTGAGRLSYDYYTDDNWHHIVFNYSKSKGRREIWTDGVLINASTAAVQSAGSVVFEASDGFKGNARLDELRFFSGYLPANAIASLSATSGKKQANVAAMSTPFDVKEFAPGFPDYTVSLTEQLKKFPAPRYACQTTLPRNISWMDIAYLHRELPGKGGKGFGLPDPARAVEIEALMYRRWHYMLDIPLLRLDKKSANRQYGSTASLAGALVQYARQYPELEYSVISMQAQQNPSHAGFSSQRPYISSQDLTAGSYLKASDGRPLLENGKKRLSPFMDTSIMRKDAETTVFYLSQLTDQLGRAPALISENGEVFGTAYRENLLQKDPAVWKAYRASGLSPQAYFGRFQTRLETVFRETVLRGLPRSTEFSIFQVSGVQPEFWADYATRRVVNRRRDGSIRSTPDFYPLTPSNWQNATGAYNGYGAIAYGRMLELELGDQNFSPFVSAGWADETHNIRPAQWLALLKAMVMLGADFFYTGYFNVTGPGGRWPNGAGPNDPRGYAYQVAMPAYAQAIRSQVPDFFTEGTLLNPAPKTDRIGQFRQNASAPNDLVLVRKWKEQYLIYGSIQPNTNQVGNVPDERTTTIELEGKKISFRIRRQGSVYVLKNLLSTHPVFYQVDPWHEVHHPYYWSEEAVLGATMFSKGNGAFSIITKSVNNSDFTDFATYVKAGAGTRLTYALPDKDRSSYKRILLTTGTDNEEWVDLELSVGKARYEWKGMVKKGAVLELAKIKENAPVNEEGQMELTIQKGTIFLRGFTLIP